MLLVITFASSLHEANRLGRRNVPTGITPGRNLCTYSATTHHCSFVKITAQASNLQRVLCWPSGVHSQQDRDLARFGGRWCPSPLRAFFVCLISAILLASGIFIVKKNGNFAFLELAIVRKDNSNQRIATVRGRKNSNTTACWFRLRTSCLAGISGGVRM